MADRYAFDLPKEFIAQKPLEKRDQSNLMEWKEGKIMHRKFYQLKDYFQRNDVLVLNDSRVLSNLLEGRKVSGGRIRLLCLQEVDDARWECLVMGKRIREGLKFIIGDGSLEGTLEKQILEGRFIVQFDGQIGFRKALEEFGSVPLPEYIEDISPSFDFERYQTCFGMKEGSIAAPTAGLHFSKTLLEDLKSRDVKIRFITLHISIGTILRIKTGDLSSHKMYPEFVHVSSSVADVINQARADGRRIFVVGTTCLKALECAADDAGILHSFEGDTDLFIYPGYRFKFQPDAFITNFHLPKSAPLLMTVALIGWERIQEMYEEAKRKKYRFYSFGDAMIYFRT
ncbi:MAG: tRNA preQ1(34) S-adenosylmethionine ribosyltransferase-isomerase QueA [Candidatus Helarchaeota archaeon]